MDKIPFNISASNKGKQALIRITGTIGWDTNAELFRTQVDGLIAQGAEDVHYYLNGPGGDCFDAEEMVNISSAFTGKVTGEGGALVASAYTRIAMICETFTMPKNGMFMIHKPSGGAYGTAIDIENNLKLLKDIEAQYLALYKTKATNTAKLETQWQAGDWWMTAAEAKEMGFITGVNEPAKIGAATTALISACGCPEALIPTINHESKDEKEMNLQATARCLGLPESASEAEVNAAIAAGVKAQTDYTTLQASVAQKEKDAIAEQKRTKLDAAIRDKRITANQRPQWDAILEANFENGCAALDGLQAITKLPVQGSAAGGSTSVVTANGKTTYQGKTFSELQDSDPDALADLEATDPSAFSELFKAEKK